MNWIDFPTYAYTAGISWLLGLILVYASTKKEILSQIGGLFVILGVVIMSVFIIQIWIHLERPPLRTLGETRLWYSVFLPAIGILFYYRWKYKWFLAYSVMMAYVFLLVNLGHP